MTRAADHAPRLMTRSEAAEYCSVTDSAFSNWVRLGIMPTPISHTKRWDRRAIDARLDQMSGLSAAEEVSEDPVERWLRTGS
jgi:hypothetical protein